MFSARRRKGRGRYSFVQRRNELTHATENLPPRRALRTKVTMPVECTWGGRGTGKEEGKGCPREKWRSAAAARLELFIILALNIIAVTVIHNNNIAVTCDFDSSQDVDEGRDEQQHLPHGVHEAHVAPTM
jgi:hypothetical protein